MAPKKERRIELPKLIIRPACMLTAEQLKEKHKRYVEMYNAGVLVLDPGDEIVTATKLAPRG